MIITVWVFKLSLPTIITQNVVSGASLWIAGTTGETWGGVRAFGAGADGGVYWQSGRASTQAKGATFADDAAQHSTSSHFWPVAARDYPVVPLTAALVLRRAPPPHRTAHNKSSTRQTHRRLHLFDLPVSLDSREWSSPSCPAVWAFVWQKLHPHGH